MSTQVHGQVEDARKIPQIPLRKSEAENWKFFFGLPEVDPMKLNTKMLLDSQLKQPLFEFSGACAGCGKTQAKKNLGLMQKQYKNVYVAYVSMGTNPACTEESHHESGGFRRGPSAKPNPKGAQAGARR